MIRSIFQKNHANNHKIVMTICQHSHLQSFTSVKYQFPFMSRHLNEKNNKDSIFPKPSTFQRVSLPGVPMGFPRLCRAEANAGHRSERLATLLLRTLDPALPPITMMPTRAPLDLSEPYYVPRNQRTLESSMIRIFAGNEWL